MNKYVYLIMILAFSLVMMNGCYRDSDNKAIEVIDEWKEENHSEEVVELTMWIPRDQDRVEEWYEETVNDFNEMYEGRIHLNLDVILRGGRFNYEYEVNAAAISGGLPDILAIDGPNIPYYAAHDILVPIDKFYTEDELSDFLPALLEQGRYKDETYAIGLNESTVVLFYNKDILGPAGIDIPQDINDAWTWEEYYEISKQLTTNEVKGTTLFNDYGEWITYCFGQMWISKGTDIISNEAIVFDGYLNSEEGIEAIKVLQKMANYEVFCLEPTPTDFEDGKAATKLGGVWNIRNLIDTPELNWGMTYFPSHDVKTSPSGSWALGITSDSKNEEYAAVVLKYMTNRENGAELARISSMLPPRLSLLDEWVYDNDEVKKVLTDQLFLTARPRPKTVIYPLLTDRFTNAVIEIINGADIEETLNKAVDEMNELK